MAELDTNLTTPETETKPEAEVDVKPEAEPAAPPEESAEIARLKAELAKQKAATDKATKEAAETKRALRAKQTSEEAQAEEAKAQQEAMMAELETLRKEKAVAATTAKVLPLVGSNETAGAIAEYLYGAEDVEAALAALQKAWTAKEKALRMEFGRIPAPGTGASDGPILTKEQLDAMDYRERAKFYTEHPDEYRKLMGR